MNVSEKFFRDIDEVRNAPIPENVIARARQSLLDYIAVTCAGARFQSEKLARYFEFSRPEAGDFKAIGTKKSVALKEAVFLNGLNGHALDFDDGTNSGIIHLGSPIFSLLLPLAERYGTSVGDLLRAAIVGYEASYTLAVSIQPGHKALGYHATGTCGVIGAALAASYMLGFDEQTRFQAFAAAAISASGMLKALDDSSELKPYNVAKTALLALTSVQLAASGFSGSDDPFGGRGFLRMMTGRDDVELRPVLLGGTYAIMKTYTKPYASCRYTHPSVEAAIALRNEHGIKPEDVESISIRTYDLAVAGHDHTDISGSYSAKMSIPYATAAGLTFGKAGLAEFSEEQVTNEGLLALTRKVSVAADPEMSAAFPAKQSALVEIKTAKGTYSRKVDFPKGEPENPLTDEEFRSRYDGLTEYALIAPEISGAVFEAARDDRIEARELVKNL